MVSSMVSPLSAVGRRMEYEPGPGNHDHGESNFLSSLYECFEYIKVIKINTWVGCFKSNIEENVFIFGIV